MRIDPKDLLDYKQAVKLFEKIIIENYDNTGIFTVHSEKGYLVLDGRVKAIDFVHGMSRINQLRKKRMARDRRKAA